MSFSYPINRKGELSIELSPLEGGNAIHDINWDLNFDVTGDEGTLDWCEIKSIINDNLDHNPSLFDTSIINHMKK